VLEVANVVITSVIAAVGLWLAYGLRRQQRLRVAEERLAAYRDLWNLMVVARTGRAKKDTDVHRSGPLSPPEALKLYDEMNAWYFGSGRGMLLTEQTKDLYLQAMRRLGDSATGARAASSTRARVESRSCRFCGPR
jgi:hypothetical protein